MLAPQRADRPLSFEPSRTHDDARAECPLDEGREDRTPPETWALRPDGGRPDSPGWVVRAVPNKYPVLERSEAGTEPGDPLSASRGEPDLLVSGQASGAHELIVHSPHHLARLADLGTDQLGQALGGWRERSAAHAGAAYVHVIVNEGAPAGASLEHSHAQLYALDFVPALIARERERFNAHTEHTMGSCLLCDLVHDEVKRRERVITVDDDAVLLAPFAARAPYELQIVPRRHEPSFAASDVAVADLLEEALQRLARKLGGSPPLNLWVRAAPRGVEHFHWHIEIVPRLTVLAGFELGTAVNINTYPPERAAADLRG